MRKILFLLAVLVMSVAAHAQVRKVDFEQDTVGQPPKGFVFGLTRKVGAPGRWEVQQDASGKHLAQLDADRTNARFPTAVPVGGVGRQCRPECALPSGLGAR